MIKRLLFYLLFFIPIFKINAQCTCVGNSLWPTSTVTASNTGLTYLISSSIYAGDTSKLTGFTGNKTYKFNSSVAADNLTLRYNSINGLVCDANPITYTFPSSPASLYSLTTHKNTTCGTESISRTTYVTCLDCVSAPANDNCSGAISITPTSGSTCTGVSRSPAGATESMPGCLGIADDDTWFSFVATQTNHSIVLSSVTYDMVTEVFSGSCGSLTQLVCSDPDITSLTGLTIGDTYYFRCYSKADGLRNTFNLCVTAPPPPPSNDECSGAINLTVNPATTCTTVTNGSTSGATQSQSACLGSGADDDVWFSFVATSTSHLIDLLNVSGSTDMLHQVFSGTCGSLTSLTCSDPNSSTTSGLTIGSTYYVRVHTYYTGSSATFDICVKTPPPPPKTWVGGTGDWGVAANWSPSGVPTCTDSVNINTGTITLNGANAECRGFIISSGTLNLNSGSLTIGVCGATDGGSKYFVQSGGTINLSGATVTLNGGFTQSAGTFTFSSGTFTIDPNGTAGVYSNTNSCNIAGTFNMSGGNLILPDASSSSGTVIYYNGTTNRNFTGGTVSIGGGNSSNTLNINTYVGSYRLAFYNLEINTSTNNTYANSSSWSFGVLNNLNIASGELRTSVAIYVNGNLNNDGIFTNSSTLYLANFTSGSATASTLAQEISGGGIYRNSTTKTAEFTTLNINNTNTSGVTFNISDPSVSGTLTLTAGKIFGQSSNQFVLWAKSSIIYTNGWVVGKLKRTISSSGATVFYIGTASTYYPVTTNFTSNPAGTLTASFEAGAPGSTGLPLTEVSGTNPYLSADSLWSTGVWRLTTADITSTTYSIAVTATGSSQNGNNANVRVIKRADNGSSWDNPGTHVNGSGIVYSRSGLSGFSEFTIVRGALLPLPLELTSINAKSINKSNKITWTTANEKNTAWHQIERANDELAEFKSIGKIAAAGNSLSSLDYSFMDENPLFMSYYRVRTIDLDGKESISPVVSVERAVDRFSIEKLYPNPTNNLLNIDIQSPESEEFTLNIFNSIGQVVYSKSVIISKGISTETFDVNNLSNGYYHLQLKNNIYNINHQFCKQ